VVKKTPPGWFFVVSFLEDEKPARIKSQYRDPYQTTRISWNVLRVLITAHI